MKNPLKSEPVATGAALLAIVAAILAALPQFGIKVTVEQAGAIMAVLVPLVAWWQRSKVSPVAPPTDKPKDDDAPPTPKSGSITPIFPAATLCLGLFACSSPMEKPPCDPASYALVAANCGDDPDICDAKITERETLCAEKIRGGK